VRRLCPQAHSRRVYRPGADSARRHPSQWAFRLDALLVRRLGP